MKTFLSIFLVLVLVLGLCACGGTASSENAGNANPAAAGLKDGQLLVGYSKVDITPEDPVPLGGYGNTLQRISTGFLDYLYATCIVMTDKDGNTAVLFGLDMVGTGSVVYSSTRTKIAEKLDIPESSIVLSASHMHSGPDMGAQHTNIGRYTPILSEALITAVDKAIANQAPADLYMTSIETEGLNFVRRYKLQGDIYVGYQSDVTDLGLPIVGHETEADHTLQLLKFDRAEDKTDILIANFQTHPHREGSASNTLMTADLVGVFREEVTAKLGYDVLYFTGASGNINPSSQIKEENRTKNYREQGKALAQYAVQADDTYVKINGGEIKSTSTTFEGKINHSEDHLVPIAREASDYWKETNSIPMVRAKYLSYGIHSPYHASAIISKASMGDSAGFDIWALSFGDVGLAVAPYEMFDTNGSFIKENSPFKMTLVATCANGANGYLPSEFACEHGGYEPDTTKYEHGSAEILADLYVGMLGELYK